MLKDKHHYLIVSYATLCPGFFSLENGNILLKLLSDHHYIDWINPKPCEPNVGLSSDISHLFLPRSPPTNLFYISFRIDPNLYLIVLWANIKKSGRCLRGQLAWVVIRRIIFDLLDGLCVV